MIKVTFFKSGDDFTGFSISGHSGYAEEGSDIICSAVSSAAYMTANTLTEIVGIEADITLDDGYMKFVSGPCNETAQAIYKGLALHLNALAEQYDNKYILCKEKLFKE